MKLFKTAMKSFIAIAFVALFTACSSTTENKKPKILIDVIEHFKSYGVKIDKMQELHSQFLFAEEAIALKIDQQGIGIYRFDPNYSKAKKKLENIEERGIFNIQARPCKAIVNGSFVMIYHDKHPRGVEFTKIFKSFDAE